MFEDKHFTDALRELSTIRDLIRFGVSQFNKAQIYFGHGTDNAWDEAVFLTLHALHLPQNIDKTVLDAKVIESEKKEVLDLLAKRIRERVPAAYLVNEAWFAGFPFYVDMRVLIPRSPLAELINNKFDTWIEAQKVQNILDIGTGSGCIAIACAYNFPEAHVDAADLSPDALAVARINLEKHNLQDRVALHQSDVFAGLPRKKYNIIISNPPYVAAEEMPDLPAEYKHEPELALLAGELGLDVVERILHDAPDYLSGNGILVVEVGNSAQALIDKYPLLPFVWLEFSCGESEVFLLNRADLVMLQ